MAVFAEAFASNCYFTIGNKSTNHNLYLLAIRVPFICLYLKQKMKNWKKKAFCQYHISEPSGFLLHHVPKVLGDEGAFCKYWEILRGIALPCLTGDTQWEGEMQQRKAGIWNTFLDVQLAALATQTMFSKCRCRAGLLGRDSGVGIAENKVEHHKIIMSFMGIQV